MKKLFILTSIIAINAYAMDNADNFPFPPTMTQLQEIDVYSPRLNNPYLMNLAIQYKSFATYETYVMKDYASGERFAQKAIAALSGIEVPPENPGQWNIENQKELVKLSLGYDTLISLLSQNTGDRFPQLTAEAMAKFDCWVEQSSEDDNDEHIQECRARFFNAVNKIQEGLDNACGTKSDCGKKNKEKSDDSASLKAKDKTTISTPDVAAWPDTANLIYMNNIGWKQQTPITVYHKIEVQNYGTDSKEIEQIKADIKELKSLYYQLKEQVAKLPTQVHAQQTEVVKVVMAKSEQQEEAQEFEILFDFDSSKVKPEYEEVLDTVAKLSNQGMTFTISGFTDTAGSGQYNDVLGMKRAAKVKEYLVGLGAESESFTTASYGKTNLKVDTPDQTPKQENRRAVISED